MKRGQTFFSITVLALFSAQGALALGQKPVRETIKFDSGVPKKQIQILRSDLEKLKTISFADPSPRLLEVLGISSATSEQLETWILDRVGYIVGEDFDFEKRVQVAASPGWKYPLPGQLPDFFNKETAASPGVADSEAMSTVMSNIGAAIYLTGKASNVLLKTKIQGVGQVKVTSPRVGILKIGEGLFDPGALAAVTSETSFVRQAYRLETLFHEGRHSDAHGKNAGFLHAYCPIGHDYEGSPACDANKNGPYTVGAEMMKEFAKNCSDCNLLEKEILKLLVLDNLSRVLDKVPPTEAELKRIQLELNALNIEDIQCAYLPMSVGCTTEAIRQRQDRMDTLREAQKGTKDTHDWDPTPEGKR